MRAIIANCYQDSHIVSSFGKCAEHKLLITEIKQIVHLPSDEARGGRGWRSFVKKCFNSYQGKTNSAPSLDGEGGGAGWGDMNDLNFQDDVICLTCRKVTPSQPAV